MMFPNILIQVIKTFLLLITIFNNCKLINASVPHHVYCHTTFMSVELPLTSNHSELFNKKVYWQNLHTNSMNECQPLYHADGISLRISLENFLKCGFASSLDKKKNQFSFYQNLIIKQNEIITSKINIICSYKVKTVTNKFKHKLVKRDVLPDDFKEDDDLEILETVEQKAPQPEVLMEVRQNRELIDGMVTVIPGTPLVMEIKLNEMANKIYGLNVNYMEVTDMAEMSETILFRGCTVDPYLFENFNLTKSNSLKAKFRAFKFPNTAFVQFRANVQICLNKCLRPQCIGGKSQQTRRRRREISDVKEEFFKVKTSFILRLNDTFEETAADNCKLQNHVKMLHFKNLHLLA